MYRTIVVGCDDSLGSLDAIALAEQLRDPEGGRLVLASMFPFDRRFAGPIAPVLYSEWLCKEAEEIVGRAAARVHPGVPYEQQTMACPSAAGGLNDIAETVDADLIVLGASHRGVFGRFAGRETVQRLLHGAPCAVAVAAPGQDRRFGDAARICVAYDASLESRYALEIAYGIAQTTGASVLLCAVLEPLAYATTYVAAVDIRFAQQREDDGRASLEEAAALAPPGVAVALGVLHGRPVRAIEEAAGPDIDLIVAGSRGYGVLRRAMAGSVSGGLLAGGRASVLVTPRVVAAKASELHAAETVA